MPLEHVSLGRSECVSGAQAELPCAPQQYIAPAMATPECRCPFEPSFRDCVLRLPLRIRLKKNSKDVLLGCVQI